MRVARQICAGLAAAQRGVPTALETHAYVGDRNPALQAAIAQCERLIPLYIHNPGEESPWAPGQAGLWWLHHSLASLDEMLRERGSRLVIRRGDSLEILKELIRTRMHAVLRGAGGKHEVIAFGVLIVVIMLFMPEGLTVGIINLLRRLRQTSTARRTAKESETSPDAKPRSGAAPKDAAE